MTLVVFRIRLALRGWLAGWHGYDVSTAEFPPQPTRKQFVPLYDENLNYIGDK